MLLNSKIPLSYILRKIQWEIVVVTLIGAVAYYLKAPIKDNLPEISLSIPAFLGTAISVILSFKLNQSYDRWWEARKVWGSIVNDSRTLVLQLQSFLPKGTEDDIRKISLRHIGWCYCLGQSLRGLNAMDNMDKYLSGEEISALSKHNNMPLAILQMNALHIANLRKENQMDVFSHAQINNTLVSFSNAMGMAERIRNTIFPATYRLFLRLFIYIFIVTLSISIADTLEYLAIPLLIVISCAFFLLEKSATLLQDPFTNKPTDTPVTSIATTIEINVKQLINEADIPQPVQAQGYYIM
jgi:putative membrane protein